MSIVGMNGQFNSNYVFTEIKALFEITMPQSFDC